MFKIQKMDFLLSLYIFCIAVSELMGSKVFAIAKIGSFPLNASVAIFTLPIIFSVNDIITEVFGKERARSIVRAGIFVVFLIFCFSALAIVLPPSVRFTPSEPSYDAVFGKTMRFAAASLIAFAASEFLDVFIFSKIRQALGKSRLWLRNNASNFVSQFVDSFIFIFLAFYALDRGFSDNLPFLFSLILPYWILKCLMSIIETPFVYAGVKWLQSEISTGQAPSRGGRAG